MGDVISLRVRIGDDDDARERRFEGRVAWTLDALIAAGDRGVTPLDRPAPRWSDYVFKLRKAGVVVETIHENHAGAYPGHHARYVLRTPAAILDRRTAA